MRAALRVADVRSHVSRLIRDLVSCGWLIKSVPEQGRLPRNGLKLVLRADDKELTLRVFVYKVTSSGRKRPHERRVEITTTYHSGLPRLRGFRDVVLGVDLGTGKYVGVDSRRLMIGGPTHNASSFFDLEGLSVGKGELLVNPRRVSHPLLRGGTELHAFFDRSRLSEYLFNQPEIHSGMYGFEGTLSGPIRERNGVEGAMAMSYAVSGDALVMHTRTKGKKVFVPRRVLAAVEDQGLSRLARAKITPEQLRQIQNLCDEIGALGEQAVLSKERRRLRRLGFKEQADRVERVSLRSVAEGYDILSFEDDGTTRRYLEVKSTTGTSFVVDVSLAEWRAATRLRRQYYLVRVTSVRDDQQMRFIRDPVVLERDGLVTRTPTGWKVDLSRARNSDT